MKHPLAHSPNPKKSLGQNWLRDETYLDRVVAAADLTSADTVLEIGPGPGNLTRRLAAQAGRVIAVELDDRLIEPLHQQFAEQPQVEIIHGDILALDPALLVLGRQGDKETGRQGDRETGRQGDRETGRQGDRETGRQGESLGDNPKSKIQNPKSYKVVANLPYYITSAVLRHLLEAALPPTLLVVMVQQEVAERICATPGEMSLLAVSVQFYAQPRIAVRVPATAFYPQPKVNSAVLRLDVAPQPLLDPAEAQHFFTLVRAGFSQKRKQLLNTISSALGMRKESASTLLQQAHIDPTRRAETLALTEWVTLYQHWREPALQETKANDSV